MALHQDKVYRDHLVLDIPLYTYDEVNHEIVVISTHPRLAKPTEWASRTLLEAFFQS